ncbi:serine hydrolase [Nakamurella deserti]|uniref:serine hydrolase n=1 Tax=Nakamurella deserti TaxID=2164074 RepID=UPI000DBE5829|nr:serine hydrolase [Nakamurella deserti]
MSDLRWSVALVDADTGAAIRSQDGDLVARTAGVGTLLLLTTAARLIVTGRLSPAERLRRTAADTAGGSGIWQHLAVDELAVRDLCQLVGSAGDNLATNVLLRRVGLETVRETAALLELRDTALLDRVRDHRGPDDPATPSTGTAVELARLMAAMAVRRLIDPDVSQLMLGWLADRSDLSMVPAGWGWDPLAHTARGAPVRLHHTTGVDAGVRCDVGVVVGPWRTVAYAVLADWDPAGPDRLPEVLAGMRDVGGELRALVF